MAQRKDNFEEQKSWSLLTKMAVYRPNYRDPVTKALKQSAVLLVRFCPRRPALSRKHRTGKQTEG